MGEEAERVLDRLKMTCRNFGTRHRKSKSREIKKNYQLEYQMKEKRPIELGAAATLDSHVDIISG